jgi:hypothetical protein
VFPVFVCVPAFDPPDGALLACGAGALLLCGAGGGGEDDLCSFFCAQAGIAINRTNRTAVRNTGHFRRKLLEQILKSIVPSQASEYFRN